jgi:hypothetical protein
MSISQYFILLKKIREKLLRGKGERGRAGGRNYT